MKIAEKSQLNISEVLEKQSSQSDVTSRADSLAAGGGFSRAQHEIQVKQMLSERREEQRLTQSACAENYLARGKPDVRV